MKKITKKEQFGWSCGYERIYGSYHADNERCMCNSDKMFDTILEAARAGLEHKHKDSTYVFSTKKGYVGLANGLYFNHITT
jgi:hypothetical protein